METKLYKPEEFAEILRITTQTLRNWEKTGKLIPIHLPTGKRRYSEKQLEKIVGENYV